MNVSIQVRGISAAIDRLGKDVEQRHQAIQRRTIRAGLNIANKAKRNVVDQGAVDRGHLKTNIRNMPAGPDAQTAGVHETDAARASVYHAPSIEYGTRPHLVPMLPLIEWAHRKFKTGRSKVGIARARAIAWGTRRGIAEHGTRARPYLMPAYGEEMHDYLIDVARILKDGR